MDAELVLSLLRALDREGVAYKVVGAVALNLLGIARATRDLDLFVAADDDNVERLRRALHSVFEDPSIDEITTGDLQGDYPAIEYIPPEGGFRIDLLNRLGEAFHYEDVEVEEHEVEGIRVPVATARMLYRMKRDTVRPQDGADAARLREQLELPDEEG